jgi:hypothetical protein
VDDLDARRARTQHRQRIQLALDGVVLLHQRGEVGVGADPVALEVEHQVPAVGLLCEQVDHTGDQRRVRARRERERMLAAHAAGRRDAGRRRRGAGSGDQPGDLGALVGAHAHAQLARDRRDPLGRRRTRAGEVERLHQPVDERPPRTRLQTRTRGRAGGRRELLRQPEHAFEVVTVATSLELAEGRVAERARQRLVAGGGRSLLALRRHPGQGELFARDRRLAIGGRVPGQR